MFQTSNGYLWIWVLSSLVLVLQVMWNLWKPWSSGNNIMLSICKEKSLLFQKAFWYQFSSFNTLLTLFFLSLLGFPFRWHVISTGARGRKITFELSLMCLHIEIVPFKPWNISNSLTKKTYHPSPPNCSLF